MKYIDADKLTRLLDAKYKEFMGKAKTEGYTTLQYQYMADGIDIAEQLIDSLQQEQPEVDLEEEISTWIPAHISGGDNEVWRDTKNAVTEWAGVVARHFAEWQKTKMLKDNPVIMPVEDFQALIDSHAKRVEADYKEKMLKEAKDGYVSGIIIHNDGDEVHYAVTYPNGKRPHSITDKVKIIIVKEEE